ncbi:ThuA domain-containing protein [Haliangium ochraceum]|uniref:ThuA domain-containing protein n=1 Tax=Haliangium ochraceum TaxID=80816 RepID=UPI0002F08406|nr:ThuA domain-containing protein [Haliangium ochraceum]
MFSRSLGYRHASIADGVAMFGRLALARGWEVTFTEDEEAQTWFRDEPLSNFDVVVWLNTSGNVLDALQEAAFERYIAAGNGFVGIHAASDTEYDWPFYQRLLGAHFDSHPPIQAAELVVEKSDHPATAFLDGTWTHTDEWYNFSQNPRAVGATVLLSLDESSYEGGAMEGDHPIAWGHELEGGRAFYTGLGHTSETYTVPEFEAHITGAVEWAGKRR